jgi:hypothetical protein
MKIGLLLPHMLELDFIFFPDSMFLLFLCFKVFYFSKKKKKKEKKSGRCRTKVVFFFFFFKFLDIS